MDGNGRWAKRQGLPRAKGHQRGAETCREIIEACQEFDVHYLTLYAFSAENWSRPQPEVSALMELLQIFLDRETDRLVEKQVRVRAIGRLEALPDQARQSLQTAIDATRRFGAWNLTLALNYSSRNEVVDASKALARDIARGRLRPEDISWETIAQRLYTRDLPDPDLIIRTSGESRLSNFLLMQSAYAELYFTRDLWPDFSKERFAQAIEAYKSRERRYGLTGDQIGREAPALL